MSPHRGRVLEQEVIELTQLMRGDPVWEDLRAILRRRKIDPGTCLLGGFMETEDGQEYGVLVTREMKAIEYQRRVRIGKQRPQVLLWREVKDVDALARSDFPALPVALKLASGK